MVRIASHLKSKLQTKSEENIQTVISIREASGSGHSQDKLNVEEILSKTIRESNQRPANYKFYPKNLEPLWIEATKLFIQKLVESPEIAIADLAEENDIYNLLK